MVVDLQQDVFKDPETSALKGQIEFNLESYYLFKMLRIYIFYITKIKNRIVLNQS